MQTVLWICQILVFILGVIYAYRVVFGVVGYFRTQKFAPAQKQHRYAIVVAARNEETVIGNLLDSIAVQDYPADLIKTFVVADNCTDSTADIARRHGAVCYERQDTERCTKGYALEYLFDRIEEDYGRTSFDGYLVFDADNLLKHDYISRMNDAFDSGERVIVSYRNTKNTGDGWLSASYALHWLRTCRLEHRGRSYFGISSRIQGTGFLFASEFVKDGWHYVSLTEDRAFSSDIVTRGVTISYQHEAEFWDEQPNSFRIACRQRLRWAKGHLQAFTETAKALFCGIFTERGVAKRLSCYDMLTTNLPGAVITFPVKLIEATLIVLLAVSAGSFSDRWLEVVLQVLEVLLFEHLSNIFLALLLFISERRRMPRLRPHLYVWYALTFPLFSIIGDIATVIAVFVKVKWKPIPHRADIAVDQVDTTSPSEREHDPLNR